MKVIDQSPIKTTDGVWKKLQFAMDGILEKGFNWDADIKAQELVAKHFSRLLDNKYTLLRNIRLAVDDSPIPLILVGPPGLIVMNPNGNKGVFQAKDENWLELDRRSRQYNPASLNLITQSGDLAKKLDAFLEKGERELPQSQPVLFLSHPGVHVDTNHPAVRIVRVDGIDRFGASLPQSEIVLDAVQVGAVVDQIAGAFDVNQKEKLDQQLKEQEERFEKKAASQASRTSPKLNLSRPQIILLAIMGSVEILLLIAVAVILLFLMR